MSHFSLCLQTALQKGCATAQRMTQLRPENSKGQGRVTLRRHAEEGLEPLFGRGKHILLYIVYTLHVGAYHNCVNTKIEMNV